jgi:hypothetical protein
MAREKRQGNKDFLQKMVEGITVEVYCTDRKVCSAFA